MKFVELLIEILLKGQKDVALAYSFKLWQEAYIYKSTKYMVS